MCNIFVLISKQTIQFSSRRFFPVLLKKKSHSQKLAVPEGIFHISVKILLPTSLKRVRCEDVIEYLLVYIYEGLKVP